MEKNVAKVVSITQQNPQLIKDINLFKILLTPSELYTLKYFFQDLHPLNIREVYTTAVFIVFLHVFNPEDNLTHSFKGYQHFANNLVNAGYGCVLVDKKEQTKVIGKTLGSKKTFSETELTKMYHKELKEHKSKVPSYDKFQGIFKRFENLGIIYKIAREGKIILFGLNPNFYNFFKDKREGILKL